MTLCEYVMEVANKEADKKINEIMGDMVHKIADEIVATAEECEDNECG